MRAGIHPRLDSRGFRTSYNKVMPGSFLYQQFRVDDDKQTVNFDYLLAHGGQNYAFTESLRFPLPLLDSPAQLRSLRALHLALGVSYYKIFTPSEIAHPYQMSADEAGFWNDVWRNGLGEFLYVNQLSPDVLAQFSEQDGQSFDGPDADAGEAALLGIGGGKDSIVAGELLKRLNIPTEGFVMATGEQLGQAKAVAKTMSAQLNVIERTIDKRLLEVQELPGAHKGHIPISLIFGLVGTALAIAKGTAYVVVANEASASIPRITWKHGAVNHQWTKSFAFEQQLQAFVYDQVTSGVTYFSAVRQLTSVGVAKLFARYPAYFEVFTSDNTVFRIDPAKRPNARWSLESPKSLSSFILLAPWLSEADLTGAFGRNFLDEASLEQLFWELTGQEGEPPLDCVGTTDELIVSLNMAVQQGKFVDSYLVKLARQRGVIADQNWQAKLEGMLDLQAENALPQHLAQPITEQLSKELRA